MKEPEILPFRRIVRADGTGVGQPGKGRKNLKVVAHVHTYPPSHNAGAGLTLHTLLSTGKMLRGWDVQVITDDPPDRTGEYDGIKVRRDRNVRTITGDYRFSHVAITHLTMTPKAIDMSARLNCPLVHLVHNPKTLSYYRVLRNQCALAVFNSESLQHEVAWDGPQIVSHPLIEPWRYKVAEEPGDAVTLVNLKESKGVKIFAQLAERHPEWRFIAVEGAYGDQMVNLPSNVEIWEHTDDLRPIYEQTRVLLMPSQYESYGRTAIEAACAGRPSLVSRTPGLKEAGVGHMFLDPDDVAIWDICLKPLMTNDEAWAHAAESASNRAEVLYQDAQSEMVELVGKIDTLV